MNHYNSGFEQLALIDITMALPITILYTTVPYVPVLAQPYFDVRKLHTTKGGYSTAGYDTYTAHY